MFSCQIRNDWSIPVIFLNNKASLNLHNSNGTTINTLVITETLYNIKFVGNNKCHFIPVHLVMKRLLYSVRKKTEFHANIIKETLNMFELNHRLELTSSIIQ